LTAQKLDVEIESIEQAIAQNLQIGTFDSDFPREILMGLGARKSQFNQRGLSEPDNFIDAIFSGRIDVIVEPLPYALDLIARDCRLMITQNEATFSESTLAFATKKDSPLYDILRPAMVNAVENSNFRDEYDRVLLRLEQESSAQTGIECPEDAFDASGDSIRFEHLRYLFYFLFGSGLVAIFCRFLSRKIQKSEAMEKYFLSALTVEDRIKLGIEEKVKDGSPRKQLNTRRSGYIYTGRKWSNIRLKSERFSATSTQNEPSTIIDQCTRETCRSDETVDRAVV